MTLNQLIDHLKRYRDQYPETAERQVSIIRYNGKRRRYSHCITSAGCSQRFTKNGDGQIVADGMAAQIGIEFNGEAC